MGDKKIELKKPLNVRVKGEIKDLIGFMKLVPNRRKRIKAASSKRSTEDPIRDLSNSLHPKSQHLIIKEIKIESKTSKSYHLIPDPTSSTKALAFFRAGQYLSLKIDVNGFPITRPYSISSSPKDALNGFYEITVKKVEGGFLTEYIWDNWKEGQKIKSSGPEGTFYYEWMRDKKSIAGFAGGSGITPFRSMARAIADGTLKASLLLFYGSADENDVIFFDELKKLETDHPKKIKIVHVLSCEDEPQNHLKGCETGYISKQVISKYTNLEEHTPFVCGPQIMYDFIEKELLTLKVPLTRIRREVFGEIKDITKEKTFPKDKIGQSFKIKVQSKQGIQEIPALATETVLVALERAKITSPSSCRSGECGFCRAHLIEGSVFTRPGIQGRRASDITHHNIHVCSAYPMEDLELLL
jgi:ferredoxin-NADP reductase